jgi:hypothetical protein
LGGLPTVFCPERIREVMNKLLFYWLTLFEGSSFGKVGAGVLVIVRP